MRLSPKRARSAFVVTGQRNDEQARRRLELIDTLAVGDEQEWRDFWTNPHQRQIAEHMYGKQADELLASSWLADRERTAAAAVRVELQAARDEAAELRAELVHVGRVGGQVDDLRNAAQRTNRFWRETETELAAARRTLDEIRALVDAADEASLRPEPVGFEPIEVPWTTAVRAILAASSSDTETRDRCRICQGADGKHDGAVHDAYVADRPVHTWPAAVPETRDKETRHA